MKLGARLEEIRLHGTPFLVCRTCGLLVGDPEAHARWHQSGGVSEGQLPFPKPDEPA